MTHANPQPRPALRSLTRLLLLSGLAALLVGAPQARAANLDAALLKAAPDVLSYLKNKDYKNVGVLPFQVKKGSRPASHLGAPLAISLPGRLENALIMCQGANEHQAVAVIRDAAGSANQAKVGAYLHNPAAYRKLFTSKYELAWGDKKVSPDVFLTGQIVNDGDRSETKIQLQALTASSLQGARLKVTNVGKPILVKTDRALLRDLGYTFALSRSVVTKRGFTAKRRDEAAIEQVRQQEEGEDKKGPAQSDALDPTNIAGIGFKLYYDGAPVPLQPLMGSADDTKAKIYQVAPMPPGAQVTMSLTRLTDDPQTLGVVLKVNGENTFRPEGDDGAYPRKWLYPPDRKGYEDVFKGIYTSADGRNLLPFRVLNEQESRTRAMELGDKAGWIQIEVYASGPKPNTDEPTPSTDDEIKVSTRGMVRTKAKFKTLKSLQTAMRKANKVKVRTDKGVAVAKRGPGGLLMYDLEPVEGGPVEIGEALPDPVLIGSITIRYYDPKASGGEDKPQIAVEQPEP
jgi:hypothetical protein